MSSTVKFLFVFCVLVSVVCARQCHLCGEYRGQYIDCRYPQQTTCVGSCGKEILNGMVRKGCFKIAEREQYREDSCFNDHHNGGWFCTCNSDYCNSSTKSTTWSALIGTGMLMVYRFVLP
ncbi:hypothetical protein M3Y98_00087400 [Aphelenchoides besseyi]|nr:hypothetical protein M3Y98_00087400 [Aphelenchoides besseyi]